MRGQRWLVTGGVLSVIAALLHLAVIAGGPDWYRFFGAGEEMARGAEQGQLMPPVLTLLVALVLSIWAAYAFSGAGRIRRLPLLRTGLVVISVIYLIRAAAGLLGLMSVDAASANFELWSSLIVLIYGATYAIGTWLAWPNLQGKFA